MISFGLFIILCWLNTTICKQWRILSEPYIWKIILRWKRQFSIVMCSNIPPSSDSMSESIGCVWSISNLGRLVTNILMFQELEQFRFLSALCKLYGRYNSLIYKLNLSLGEVLSGVFHTNSNISPFFTYWFRLIKIEGSRWLWPVNRECLLIQISLWNCQGFEFALLWILHCSVILLLSVCFCLVRRPIAIYYSKILLDNYYSNVFPNLVWCIFGARIL